MVKCSVCGGLTFRVASSEEPAPDAVVEVTYICLSCFSQTTIRVKTI